MKHNLASSQLSETLRVYQRHAEIARCDREQAEIKAMGDNHPAWLTTLGLHDWEMEKEFLRHNHTEGCQPMTCEGDPKREGAQGVNGRGTQPLKSWIEPHPFWERRLSKGRDICGLCGRPQAHVVHVEPTASVEATISGEA